MELFAEIFATMRMNRMRTFLTGFAIAWGIFMLVALLAVGNGLKHGVYSNFNDMNKNTVTLYPGNTSIPFEGRQRGREIIFNPSDIDFIRNNMPNATDFAPIINMWSSSVTYNDLQITVANTGVEPSYAKVYSFTIEAGRFINDIDMRERRKVVVIPTDVCEKYFTSYTDALGKYLRFSDGTMFKIVGVYSKKGRTWQPEVYIPLATANIIYNPSGRIYEISFVLNGITTAKESEAYTEKIRGILARRFHFSPDDQNAIWISNQMQSFQMIQLVFTGISLFIWMIGIGTLIAGIVGVCNIMIVTVRERTREFGVRRAIGATPASIIRMVIIEAITITTLFGYIGMMLGIGLSEVLCMFFPAGAQASEGNMPQMFVEPSVDLTIILSATTVLIIAGIIAGYIPARRAVKIKPIEAISAK